MPDQSYFFESPWPKIIRLYEDLLRVRTVLVGALSMRDSATSGIARIDEVLP